MSIHHEGHGSMEFILSTAEGLTTDYEHEVVGAGFKPALIEPFVIFVVNNSK